MDGADNWQHLLVAFASAFTQPSLRIFFTMATAWVICPGRRVVTRLYLLADPAREAAHDAYHRFLREGAWALADLFRLLALTIVSYTCRTGRIPIDLDDTLYHKSGRKVDGAGWWRDAVRSTNTKMVSAFGLNLVVLTLRVTAPWGGEPLGLPVNMRLHRKGGKTLIELASEMIREFCSWFPQREFNLCADGAYATLAGAALPRVHVTSRMRRDAALYAPAPKRRKGQRGRPRTKGRRLPTPEQMAKTKKGWRRVVASERGKPRERLVLVRRLLWYRVCRGSPVLLVISRDPEGKEHDDFFFTTDLCAYPEVAIGQYAGRWSIEDTFKNVKQLLGGEQPQTWKGTGPERVAGFSLWLYSAVWLWYITTHGARKTWNPLPWYREKSTPSFADALAALRRVVWHQRLFEGSKVKPLTPKMAGRLIEVLAHAA